mmetsp:Transcript_1687/g.3313  ORF Transcript_1687/g.3313 Transcript_1687/m.3313 type:complete len:302 (-) Transcript_1687:93-998(-)
MSCGSGWPRGRHCAASARTLPLPRACATTRRPSASSCGTRSALSRTRATGRPSWTFSSACGPRTATTTRGSATSARCSCSSSTRRPRSPCCCSSRVRPSTHRATGARRLSHTCVTRWCMRGSSRRESQRWRRCYRRRASCRRHTPPSGSSGSVCTCSLSLHCSISSRPSSRRAMSSSSSLHSHSWQPPRSVCSRSDRRTSTSSSKSCGLTHRRSTQTTTRAARSSSASCRRPPSSTSTRRTSTSCGRRRVSCWQRRCERRVNARRRWRQRHRMTRSSSPTRRTTDLADESAFSDEEDDWYS